MVNAVKKLYGAVHVVQDTVMGFAERFTTDELCIGSTCITESELKAILEERDIEAADPSGGNTGENTPEPDGEIGAPASQDDADAAQDGMEPPDDPSAESSGSSEEVDVAEASDAPPAEALADEPNTSGEPVDEAPSPTSTESTSPDQTN